MVKVLPFLDMKTKDGQSREIFVLLCRNYLMGPKIVCLAVSRPSKSFLSLNSVKRALIKMAHTKSFLLTMSFSNLSQPSEKVHAFCPSKCSTISCPRLALCAHSIPMMMMRWCLTKDATSKLIVVHSSTLRLYLLRPFNPRISDKKLSDFFS